MSSDCPRALLGSFILALLAACGGGDNAGPTSTPVTPASTGPVALALQQVATGLDSPLFLTAPDGDTRLFIVERPGRIRVVQNGALLSAPFLDISDRTTTSSERGMLSMAFDPQYATNGSFYIFYTDLNGDLAIERFSVSTTNPNLADPASGIRILSIPHPNADNHNGGLLSFGPDGDLYIGTGDGGGEGDPNGNAQNTDSLLGKLLRIDVRAASAAQPYTIPATNPFINQVGKRPEIWAYGLRNPWRYAFDAAASLLYIADVGGDQREEVDVVPADQGGLNFGWNIMEGSICLSGDTCDRQGLTLPVLDYSHADGCAIVGGYVYRGTAIPEMQGQYFYSDLCAGFLKSFTYSNGAANGQTDWPVMDITPVLSFGQDSQKELYMLSQNGTVYRIARQ